MKIYYGLSSIKKIKKPTAIALGVFDGLHRGHKKVLNNLKSFAKKNHLKSLVITFEPHPEKLWNKKPIFYINTLQERLSLIEALGIDYCLVINFSQGFASMEAKDFVCKILKDKLNLGGLVISQDYKFGNRAQGDSQLLKDLAKLYSFKLKVIKPLKAGGHIVNSSAIRKLLSEKKLYLAAKLLARPYFIEGEVVKGNQIGTKLGFPTINLSESENLIIPQGVYLASLEAGRKKYKAVVNVGFKPSINPHNKKRHIEAHLLDFKGNLRHKHVRVYFFKWLRDERHFKSLEELKKAIAGDAKRAKRLFKVKKYYI